MKALNRRPQNYSDHPSVTRTFGSDVFVNERIVANISWVDIIRSQAA
jgi:hypothetical protein